MKHFLLLLICILASNFFSGCIRNHDQSDVAPDKQVDNVIQDDYNGYGYHPDTEVPEGKGILSEESGEFIIFRK